MVFSCGSGRISEEKGPVKKSRSVDELAGSNIKTVSLKGNLVVSFGTRHRAFINIQLKSETCKRDEGPKSNAPAVRSRGLKTS